VVDTASEQAAVDEAASHGFSVIQPGDLKLGAAIQAGIAALAQRPNWIWILHDDSAPEPEALRQLAKAAEISPSVAMIGPKLLKWDHPIEIQQLGLTATKTGRPFLQVANQYDQGQHDSAADTLSVSTAGMLISLGLWEKLGGLDDTSPAFAQDLELGIRARAAGFRVIVEPSARVHHAGLSMAGQRSRRWLGGTRRQGLSRAHIHVASTLLPLWSVLLLYLALPLLAVASIPANLLAKTPGRSLGQFTGWLWAWLTVGSRFAARSRTRRLGSLSPIGTLLATRDQIRARRRDDVEIEVEPKNPVRGLFSSGSILLALVPLAFALTRFPTAAISAEHVSPIGRSLEGIWLSVSSQTLSYLDGVSAPSDPFNWFFALVALFAPTNPNLALATFVFAAPALVCISAWLTLGIFSTRPWVRSSAALLLALSPQVQELANSAAVVELAAIISLLFATFFLYQSVHAFNSARAWRWMALAGLTGAVLAISSPLLFALLFLIAIWIGSARPARLAILLWFVIPGFVLLLPWLGELGLQILSSSSARITLPAWDLLDYAILGICGLLLVLAFGLGRISISLGLALMAALIMVATRVELLAGFAELTVLLVAVGAAALAEIIERAGEKTYRATIGGALVAALGSGLWFGALATPAYALVGERQMPALVVAQADVDPGTRVLVIDLGSKTRVDFVWGDGRAQEKVALRYASSSSGSSFRPLLAQLSGSLLAGNPDGLSELLQATSTDFVLLRGDADQVAAARVTISSSGLFQDSGETEFGVLLRSLIQSPGAVSADHPLRQVQLAALAAFSLLALPTVATVRGSRRVGGRR